MDPYFIALGNARRYTLIHYLVDGRTACGETIYPASDIETATCSAFCLLTRIAPAEQLCQACCKTMADMHGTPLRTGVVAA